MKVRYQHTQTLPDGRVVQHDYEHSGPFLSASRIQNYRLQNPGRSGLTVRQARQVKRASTRMLYRGSRAAS